MAKLTTRISHAWNAFSKNSGENPLQVDSGYHGPAYSRRPDRTFLRITNERTIIGGIYTRLSIDVASVALKHVRVDDQGRYVSDMDSGLNNCLTLEANVDQAARAFRQDVAATLFDKGVAAIVPVDTSISPISGGGFDILTLRVGEIVTWYPDHVRVSLFNQALGQRQEIVLPKRSVAIIENPLYQVMNEPNSTLQRLVSKLSMLDAVDEQTASGKLDLIIQLPYVIKSEARKQQAEQRRSDIEVQLKGSKYGIAYTDGTEKITQLNRPAENNLMAQVDKLTVMLYGQLGLTEEVMNGTADEKTMLNYWNRTIEPVLTAITEGMRRSFLTKTARSQKQTVLFFQDPFKLVPIGDIAEIADKFTRNEILSANEIRGVVGYAPSSNPKADELRNSNMPQEATAPSDQTSSGSGDPEVMSSAFDEIDAALDEALGQFGVSDDGVDDEAA